MEKAKERGVHTLVVVSTSLHSQNRTKLSRNKERKRKKGEEGNCLRNPKRRENRRSRKMELEKG